MSDKIPLRAQVVAAKALIDRLTPHQLVRAGIASRPAEAEYLIPKLKAALLTLQIVERNEGVVRDAIERANSN